MSETDTTSGVQQLAIFSPDELPDAPHLVEAAKEFKHTGKITRRDHELVEAMLRLHALGVSAAAISRKLHVSRNTVSAIVNPSDAQAHRSITEKLEQLKGVQFGQLAELFALSTEQLKDMMLTGQVDPKVLAVVMGISVEKMLLLTGHATQIVETKRGPDRDEIGAYLDRLRRVVELSPADGQSAGNAENAQQIEGWQALESVFESIQAGPDPAIPAAGTSPAPTTPGGGIAPAARPAPPNS